MMDDMKLRKEILGVDRKALPKTISKWRPFSDLNPVGRDISGYGYDVEYALKNKIHRKKAFNSMYKDERICFFEPLEVKVENGEVYYRENDDCVHFAVPETFETQFGTFYNNNNGEFSSWLGKKDPHDYYIDGNYCDMFDCGNFVYAVSNLLHMSTGSIKVVRIDAEYNNTVVYTNMVKEKWSHYEYDGRYSDREGYSIIISGFIDGNKKGGIGNFKDKTHLIHIDNEGNCTVEKEWDVQISSSGSFAVLGDCAYFGQNKMISRLNLSTGELSFFTHKSEEELALLADMYD